MYLNAAILLNLTLSFASSHDLTNTMQKAMVVDEDGRKTEEEYAAAHMLPLENVQKRFAATGVIKCKSFEGTAQLTGASDIITTVAHVLYEDNCKQKATPEECLFKIKNGPHEETRKMSLVGIGYKCPNSKAPSSADDWAVFKLNSKINNVDPYGIPQYGEEIKSEDDITAISMGPLDFVKSRNIRSNPKVIENCNVKKIYRRRGDPALFDSTCDSGSGASGSAAIMRRNGSDVVIGVLSGSVETTEQEATAIRRKTVNRGGYVESKWTTFFVPLDGDFLVTVRNAIANSSL